MVFSAMTAWAATPKLTADLEVAGYKAKVYYDFTTNTPAVLPTTPNSGNGILTYRESYGLHNFGSGSRSATATIPVSKDDLIIFETYISNSAASGSVTINNATIDENISAATGFVCYIANSDAESITFNTPRYWGIRACFVMEKDASAATAAYTINYYVEDQLVKADKGEAAVGGSVATEASFFVDDVKYIREEGEAESFTIAASGNDFDVFVRKAATFNYAVVSSLGGNIVTGTGLEGEKAVAGYPRYAVADGKLFEAAVTNKEYRKSLALDEDNLSVTVEYAEKEGVNAVFFAEGENIEGMTTSTSDNIPIRASNAKAGVSTEDVTITTLPAGKYILHVGAFTSKSSGYDNIKVKIGYGETIIDFATASNLHETASEEIELTAATEIKYFGTTSSSNAQLDYIWIEKTDATEPEPVGPEKFYIMGNGTTGGWDATTEMTFNAETEAFEYTVESTDALYITFGDATFTNWDDFNANNRYAIGEGDQNATVGEAMQLIKVNGTLVLAAGKYNISVTKADLKCTITSVKPEPVLNTYTATFTTNAGWEKVYAYAWSGDDDNVTKFLGDWPGTELTAANGVYTATIKAEAAPEKIIFNNGNSGEGNQTADLAFENGKAYEYTVELPILADGKYYVKNAATSQLMAGGHSWGTRGIVNEKGLDFVFTYNKADKTYTIDSRISNGGNNHFLGSGMYLDSGAFGWTIEGESTFTISGVIDGVKKYISVDDNQELILVEDATVAATQWTFVAKNEFESTLKMQGLEALKNATAENGVDATFLISCPDFNRNDLRNDEAWTIEASNKNLKGGGNNGNGCAESYHSTFTLSQVLADAPAGVYTFTAQGFYRQDGSDNENLPYFYANSEKQTFPVLTGEENNMEKAGASFLEGKYTIEPITVKVSQDGALTVGAKLETNTLLWCIWDNFKLTYFGPVPADQLKGDWEKALADAQATLVNNDYAAVTGEEKTALQQAITTYTNVEDKSEAYTTAIAALTQATLTFTTAKAAYEELIAAKAAMPEYQYASQAKKAAAQEAKAAEPVNAADATAKKEALYAAFRQYAESSALLEGVEGATDMTSYIVNPAAEEPIAAPWNVVLGEGSGGSLNILNGEPWTDGDGNATHKYFDGGNWGAQSWDVSLKQEIKLPKGKYQLTAKMRASADVNQTIFAGENSTKGNSIGATGGLFNRGWSDVSVEFELTEAGAITIGVQGVTEKQYNWMSFSDFRLVSFEKYEPVYTVAGSYKVGEEETDAIFGVKWDAAASANDMTAQEDGSYTLSKEDVALTTGTILYKVVADHSWNINWGFNGENADYNINLPEGKNAAIYDITFKFNRTVPFANGFNVDCEAVLDEIATSISEVNATVKGEQKSIYTLSGQKVEKAVKGLYIINGKKVVVK